MKYCPIVSGLSIIGDIRIQYRGIICHLIFSDYVLGYLSQYQQYYNIKCEIQNLENEWTKFSFYRE